MDSYLPHAGYVQFPRRPDDLTSAVCPACFSPRSPGLCATCGLDLASPLVADLDAASTDAAASLERRLELIGRIRYESTLAAAPATPVTPPPPVTAPAAAPAPATFVAPPPAAPAAAPVTPAPVAAAAEPRRHLGVQVILLIVGASLVAVGAIFFLVYAFINFGLVWRSVIIGAVTVASFVGASLLRRRKLVASAEAIAALAVVFVYLDAFAIRANNLFGAADSDALLYWGIALLVSSIGFAVWHRLSGLRLPNIVAFTSFAPSLALLVGGATPQVDDGIRLLAAFLALAAGALIHRLAKGTVERTITLVLAVLGLVVAAFCAFFVQPSVDWAPLLALGLVVVVAGAHVALLRRGLFATIIACLGAVLAAVALLPVAIRIGEPALNQAAPLVWAVIVALMLEFVARRTGSPVAVGAAWSGAGVAAVIAAVVAGGALFRAVAVAALGTDRWSIRGGEPIDSDASYYFAAGALVVVVVLVAGAWALGGVLRKRRLVIASAALGVLVLTVPLLGQLWLAVLAWLVLGAASVALLIVGRRRAWSSGIRVAVLSTGVASLALSYSASWASIDTWWFASVGTVVLLVVARAATPFVPVRALLLGVATVLAFVAIGSEAWHTNERFQGGAGAGLDALHAVCLLAILLVALSGFLSRALSAVETRTVFWLALATAVVTAGLSAIATALGSSDNLVLPEFATSVVLGALLLGALVVWVVKPTFGPERIAVSIALAPATAWLFDSIVRLAGFPDFTSWVAPLVATLVVAAVSLFVTGSRTAHDIGVAVVGIPMVIAAVTARQEVTWLVLLLAGVTALLLAVSRDGLFASASPRKHLGWLALALGFASLVWSLADRGVRDLEPYVLPLTGALLIIALLAWRVNRTNPAPAFVALGALLVSLVPLGVVGADGTPTRAIIVAGVSALLLLVGSFLRGSIYLDVAAAAGAAGLVVAGFARPAALGISAGTGGERDAWLAATVAVILVAAVGQSRLVGRARGIIAQVVVGLALAVAVLIAIPALTDSPAGTARALVIVGVLAGIHVAGMLVEKPPFTRVIAWVSLGLATVTLIAGSITRAIDPFEWGTALLALALLVTGAVLLRRYPTASSWPWIAPGLLVLLVPSLLATFVDQPIWRLVGIGVVCVVAILVGAVRKLQAPLLIGSVVVLIHAIRTFSPQLVAVYQLTEWWVWAVVGGAIIIFVAVTFERRMRDLKSLGTRIAALR